MLFTVLSTTIWRPNCESELKIGNSLSCEMAILPVTSYWALCFEIYFTSSAFLRGFLWLYLQNIICYVTVGWVTFCRRFRCPCYFVSLFLCLKVTVAMLCWNTFCLRHIHVIYVPIPFITTQPPQLKHRHSPRNLFFIRLVFVMPCHIPAIYHAT